MKKVLFTILMILGVCMFFSQSYDSYLSKAKEYGGKKQWCLALDAYYDCDGSTHVHTIPLRSMLGN